MDILYGQGISREGDLIDFGAEREVVEKSGSWFSFEGERLGQGRDNACRVLKENPEIRDRVEAAIRLKIGLPKSPAREAETQAKQHEGSKQPEAKQPEAQIARTAAKSASL